jgi:ankyrin repeat protein
LTFTAAVNALGALPDMALPLLMVPPLVLPLLLLLLLLLLLSSQMLQHGGDVNVVDYDQRTGLMLASAQGHTLAVSKLIDAGAHVNHQDKLGSSALLEAVKAGHDGVIE